MTVEEKKKVAERIRSTLDKWENEVNSIGNECAYTDRMLDELPLLVEKMVSIGEEDSDRIEYSMIGGENGEIVGAEVSRRHDRETSDYC